jgi:hypothetical protein
VNDESMFKRSRWKPEPAESKFALTWLHEMRVDLDGAWLMKRLMPRVGVGSLYGDTMSFKTFLAIHLAFCVATGRNFAKHMNKNVGPVVYIAAEDSAGVELRLFAYHKANAKEHGAMENIPIATIKVTPNLGATEGDIDELIKAVEAALKLRGFERPSLIVVDTLNQTLFDNDENGEGMQAFMSNVTTMSKRFECFVLATTHVGHADKSRERGGSQITGNADCRLRAERVLCEDGGYETNIRVVKVKNGAGGFDLRATLEKFVIGEDSDGDVVDTLIVKKLELVVPEAKEPDVSFKFTAGAPFAPLIEHDEDVLAQITTRIMQGRPVVDSTTHPESAPKLFSLGRQGGNQKRAKEAAIAKSVEALFSHGKIHAEQAWTKSGNEQRQIALGPLRPPVERDPNAPRPWPRRNGVEV